MTKRTHSAYKKIFTPQGELGKVQKKPNLDFLMNIFNIPRIYGVSGFGKWNVGQHSLCTAFLALYWAKYRKYPKEKRGELVTLAITHDLHEAVTGDILPFFKTKEVRKMIDRIQGDIVKHFSIGESSELQHELKLLDMTSFLYEIRVSGHESGLTKRNKLLEEIYVRQREDILAYASKAGIPPKNVEEFLHVLGL